MGKDIKDIQIIDKFPQGILKGPKILLNHDLINTIMSTAGIFSSKKHNKEEENPVQSLNNKEKRKKEQASCGPPKEKTAANGRRKL